MKEEISPRTRIVPIRLTAEEYTRLEGKLKESTCRTLSDYMRHRLFDTPLVTTYRSQSMDDLMAELALLRTELNRIGTNFNQSVHRLHTLDRIPEFKAWLMAYDVQKNTLFNKMDEIKKQVQKIAESWFQS